MSVTLIALLMIPTAVGLSAVVTALLTVFLWLLVVTAIFDSLVVMGLTIVGFVLVVTLPVALVTGIALMYARCRAG